ncbi:MAG: nucleotide exchange factor GrpE, partial [Deltaproteobacteria bacterium]|nr:nucleotide exchange factor GrpE [Deltaproteobacteria bacterium]
SRRTTDGLARFGGIMDKFEAVFSGVLARLERANEGERQTKNLEEKRAMFLPLVDLYDRFQRLENRLAAPPPMGFFGGARRRQAWESVRKGFSILQEHFAALLREAGVEELATVGQVFDPRSMKVVEVEETAAGPAEVVLEELVAGYLYQGQVLRLAEVKVAKDRKKDRAQLGENR